MKYPKYKLKASSDYLKFEFVSVGVKGKILKTIFYEKVNEPNSYNLAFGDYMETMDDIDDEVVSNNGDAAKVLATVATSIYEFFKIYPNAFLTLSGSSPDRTRLYRMIIANNWQEITLDFQVFARQKGKNWERFEKNQPYLEFLLIKKQ